MGWPDVSSAFGKFDIAGFRKVSIAYYEAWWKEWPSAAGCEHAASVGLSPDEWTAPTAAGQKIEVRVMSCAHSAELFVNGKKFQQKQKMARFSTLKWMVPFQAGNLTAVAFNAAGNVVGTKTVLSAGKAAKLRVSVADPYHSTKNASRIVADGQDAALVTVELLDAAGILVPHGDVNVSFTISSGASLARVVGTSNGDPTSHVPASSATLRTYHGLLRGIVESSKPWSSAAAGAGKFTVRATADGVVAGEVSLEAVAPPSSFNAAAETPQKKQMKNDDDDMAVVKRRTLAALLPSAEGVKAAVASARSIAKSMNASCQWPDIDYNEFRRAGWPMESHLGRALTIAQGWRALSDQGEADASLLESAKCSTSYWITRDPLNPNWFDNMITTPSSTSKIALLLEGHLLKNNMSKIDEIMRRSVWEGCPTGPKCGSPAQNYAPWTGANIAYMLAVQVSRGLLENNASVVSAAFKTAFAACRKSPQSGSGIQKDNSFHQHGPQLLPGSYGGAFVGDILSFVMLSTGTNFAIKPEQLKVFSGLVLDGMASMSRGGIWDWQVVGRDNTVKGTGALGWPESSVRAMAIVQPAEAKRWQALADSIWTRNATFLSTPGNKAMYCSDYASHSPPAGDYFFSVHMSSARTKGSACVNEQGKKSRKLSDGATSLLYTGNEYSEVFVAWDWWRPPGTTTVKSPLTCANAAYRAKATFVGSVSDGRHGAAAMDLKTEVSAHKTWHFFDRFIVCLGHIGKLDILHKQAFTTWEQQRLGGAVTVNGKIVAPGVHTLSDVRSLHHARSRDTSMHGNGTAYVPLAKASAALSLENLNRTGDWSAIGVDSGKQTVEVFDLYQTHRRAGEQYAYVVLPSITAKQGEAFAANAQSQLTFKIAPNVHAVRSAETLSAAFFGGAGGSVDHGGWTLSADHAVIVLVTAVPGVGRSKMANVSVSIPSPTKGAAKVHVKLNECHLEFTPPTGDDTGKTQTLSCRLDNRLTLKLDDADIGLRDFLSKPLPTGPIAPHIAHHRQHTAVSVWGA